jgi:hypothetical protein
MRRSVLADKRSDSDSRAMGVTSAWGDTGRPHVTSIARPITASGAGRTCRAGSGAERSWSPRPAGRQPAARPMLVQRGHGRRSLQRALPDRDISSHTPGIAHGFGLICDRFPEHSAHGRRLTHFRESDGNDAPNDDLSLNWLRGLFFP